MAGLISTLSGLQQVAGAEYLAGEVYGSAVSALETASELGYQVVEGGKVATTVTQVAGELTGGVETGSTVLTVIEGGEAGAEVYSIGTAGAGVSIGFGSLVAGVLAGAGIGLVAESLAPNFWTKMSNAIFGTDVPPVSIGEYFLGGLWNNGYYYVPLDYVQKILDTANELGMFKYGITQNIPDVGTTEYTGEVSKSYITYSIQKVNALSDIVSPNRHNRISSSIADGLWSRAEVYMRSFPCNYMWVISSLTNLDFSRVTILLANIGLGSIKTDSSNRKIWETPNASYINVRRIEADIDNYTGNVTYTEKNENRYRFDLEETFTVEANIRATSNVFSAFSTINENFYPIKDDANIYDPSKSLVQNFPAWVNGLRYIARLIESAGVKNVVETPYLPLSIPEYDPYKDPDAYKPFAPFPDPNVDPQQYPQTGTEPNPVSPTIPDPYSYPEYNPKPYPTDIPVIPIPTPEGGGKLPDPTPTPTPGGDTPIPVIPPIGGEANALFTVYNPTQANLNSLGGVLWSKDIITQIVTMFTNNPLDAIISLHILYATPSVNGNKNIKLGYIDTGISSKYVNKQYVEINCGTVTVAEFFGDARDYSPFTKVSIYLPFVGIRELKTEDIVGSKVTINYKVDVFTGTVLCTITVFKPNVNQILYTFEGNCAVNLPLTGADKSRQIASLGSIMLGGVAGGVGGMAIEGARALSHGGFKAEIQRSGNFSGNAGAMGYKKPYIIISRSVPCEADNYNEFYGFPANKTVSLSMCSGFTRVKEIHIDNINTATSEEKDEIEKLLKEGVIIV